MPISRRAVLLGGVGGVGALVVGGALVEEDVLPGRTSLYRALGLNGPGAPMPTAAPGELVSGTFASAARGGIEVPWTVAYPHGSPTDAPLPVLVALHGASMDHTFPFEHLGLDRFLTLGMEDGVPPFAIASVDGDRTYWRPQPDGTDAGAMVTDEFIPLLADRGLDTTGLALIGWSMGGYGVLRLAGRGLATHAVVAASPALNPLDDDPPNDLDVLGHPERLDGVTLRVDCGRGDPFYPHVHGFVDALSEPPAGGFGRGGHNDPYWRSVAPAQLAFVGAHL
jgi:hypothetical protein